jgi:hypothetical protein
MRLEDAFDEVIEVDSIDSGDARHLALLQRPELGVTFTKIHAWRMTQFSKCVFLDADTLVTGNVDELFDRETSFAAAPDVGWPDCFNSGVFLFTPSLEVGCPLALPLFLPTGLRRGGGMCRSSFLFFSDVRCSRSARAFRGQL